MATRTATVMVRTQPETKEKAERVFARIGLSTSDAVNLFLNQVAIRNEIPFRLQGQQRKIEEPRVIEDMSREEIRAMLQESFDDYKAGRTYSVDEVFDELEEDLKKWYSE